ncbi:Putative uncharacterized protein [Taphrina deformans PYCC 5710]|uniref:Protein YIP n=1 Tax=Taphrina deformans (strain PYCC 5710 / ATCC 11124 / CBS 356.35 / IMI 108563 / JCM 9778 / NBRC 8474) TaxID=1097556 RepID=R4X7U2_TAPDE|nr:Putative uncharacterized protein [Taphrina deformans PYCC 5710]|eukprot:CCG81500.1 Putative uncharacterized protein [Taphrina deformans PYCC 5710]
MSRGYDRVIDSDVAVDSDATGPRDSSRNSLQFQNFHANETLETGQQDNSSGGFFTSGSSTQNVLASKKYLWSIDYYSQFFNVSSDSVLDRLLNALFPMKNFFEIVNGQPDLYAPIWLATTVITVLYFASTVAGYLASHISHQPYAYQFSTLTSAATLIYGYTFITPVLAWGVLRWYQCEPSLLETVSLYGYSNAAWVPVSFISISPLEFFHYATLSNWIRWIAVAVGFSISVAFLIRNLLPVVNRADAKTSQLMVVGVVLLHIAFSLAIKFLFFSYVHAMD